MNIWFRPGSIDSSICFMRVSIADIILSMVIGAWIGMVGVCSRADDCVKGGVFRESNRVFFVGYRGSDCVAGGFS